MKKLVLGLILLGSLQALAQSKCELTDDRGGIKIYLCSTSNEKTKSVRVELLAKNATIREFELILDNVQDYVKWQYQVIEAMVLERKNPTEMVYRTRVSAPAFIEDREMILRMKKKKDPQGKRLDVLIRSDPFPYEQGEDLVRVTASQTTWLVNTVGTNTISIVYTIQMDPGGSIPIWLLNEAMTVAPYETFYKLKEMLED